MGDLSLFKVDLYFDRNGSYVVVRVTLQAENKEDVEFCIARMYPGADMHVFM